MLQAILNQISLTWKLIRDPRVPLWAKAIPVVAVLYVLSPIDVLPDIIPVIGQLDDLGIVLAAMRMFESVIPAYIADEYRAQIERKEQSFNTVDSRKYRVVEEEKAKRG